MQWLKFFLNFTISEVLSTPPRYRRMRLRAADSRSGRAEPTARPPRALPEASLAVPLPGGPWSCSALAAVSQHLSPSGAAAVCAPVPPVPPKDAGGGNAGRRARGRGPADATREAAWGARPVWTPENPVTAEDRERDDAGTVRGFPTP